MAFPGTYNINYYRGDTYVQVLYPKDSAGNSYDLGTVGLPATQFTGYLNIATDRGTAGTFTAKIALEFDYANNSITMRIPAATGANLSASTVYVYDVEITKDNDVYTLLTGNIFVTDDVKES